jgi:hypothetical protein
MGNLMNTQVRQEAHPTETETAATHSQARQNGSETECDQFVQRTVIAISVCSFPQNLKRTQIKQEHIGIAASTSPTNRSPESI